MSDILISAFYGCVREGLQIRGIAKEKVVGWAADKPAIRTGCMQSQHLLPGDLWSALFKTTVLVESTDKKELVSHATRGLS